MNLFVLLPALIIAANANFPTNFQKCNRKDSNFDKCAQKATQNGLAQLTRAFPEARLPCVDPLEVAALSIAPGSKGIVAFQQNFKNCQFHGISKTQVNNITFNFDIKHLFIDATIENLTMQCNYNFNGKVLLLPIVGNGSSTIILNDINVFYVLKWKESETRDKTFMTFVSSNLTLNPGLMTFNFKNLFKRIRGLGDNINRVLNDNWRDVYVDIRGGYEDAIRSILLNLFNNFFSKISMEDAFD